MASLDNVRDVIVTIAELQSLPLHMRQHIDGQAAMLADGLEAAEVPVTIDTVVTGNVIVAWLDMLAATNPGVPLDQVLHTVRTHLAGMACKAHTGRPSADAPDQAPQARMKGLLDQTPATTDNSSPADADVTARLQQLLGADSELVPAKCPTCASVLPAMRPAAGCADPYHQGA